MLDIKEIEYWISRYEQEADKLDQCVTLSALYSIRDKMLSAQAPSAQPRIAAYSEASAPVGETLDQYGDSEFLQAVAGKNAAAAWSIMDKHMETIRVVNPRAYEGVMRKLAGI